MMAAPEFQDALLWRVQPENHEALATALRRWTLLDQATVQAMLNRLPFPFVRGLRPDEGEALRQQFEALGAEIQLWPAEQYRRLVLRSRSWPEDLESLMAQGEAFWAPAFLGAPREKGLALRAAWREAVANAATHGNGGRPELSVEAALCRTPRAVSIQVADQGAGFDWRSRLRAVDSAPADQLARGGDQPLGYGGLGLMLMVRGCDRMEFDETGRRVRLEIIL